MNQFEIYPAISNVRRNSLSGDFAMFGVSQYDAPIVSDFCTGINAENPITKRRVFLFDSFKGLPSPKKEEISNECSDNFSDGRKIIKQEIYKKGDFSYPKEKVLKSLNGNCTHFFIEGYFEESLPNFKKDDYGSYLKFSAIWIDVDLPSSLTEVLDFLLTNNLLDKKCMIACHEGYQKNIIKKISSYEKFDILGYNNANTCPFLIDSACYFTVK